MQAVLIDHFKELMGVAVIQKLKSLPWARIVISGILVEALNIAFLFLVVLIYSTMVHPGLSEAEYGQFALQAGPWVAPRSGFVICVVISLWNGRKARENSLLVGILTALVSVIADLLLGGGFTRLELWSYGLRVLGSSLGAIPFQRRLRQTPCSMP